MESSDACSFLFHAELGWVSVTTDAVSSTCCKKVKRNSLLIALLFVFFIYSTQEVLMMEPWKLKLEQL
jgi:succinate dehydrogenase hydrophobic anchor subunit